MATDKEYMSFILEQLSEIDGITCRQMMGEYIIYLKDKIAAYVCDNRLLIKPTSSSLRLMENASFEPPYEGAKDMILCDRVDDREFLKELFEAMYDELPCKKVKKNGKKG